MIVPTEPAASWMNRDFRPRISFRWACLLAAPLLLFPFSAAHAQSNQELAELRARDPHRFKLGSDCALCHSNSYRAVAMRDGNQKGIAPFDLWQSSMMANSSRDPFWKAVVSAEVAATPSLKPVIEEKCTRCHAPMAGSQRTSPDGEVLAFLKGDSEQAKQGQDGVSCTVCHQITDEELGLASSFTGHFHIGTNDQIFGPHKGPVTMPMQRHVGYTPTYSDHILESSLCATCHTLLTTSVDPSGKPTVETPSPDGNFHEQAPYLEWRNSVFNTEVAKPNKQARSCQSCHVPTTDSQGNKIATRLAHNPGGRDFPFLRDRDPFGRHTFVGSNTLLLQILRDNREALGVVASEKAFDRTLAETREFLGNKTASIHFDPGSRRNNANQLALKIQNLAGHKLPTAYPSRRMWIHLIVHNAKGDIVYRSGAYNESGQLVDQVGNVLPSELADGPLLRHQSKITNPDQPQVYESIMADAAGQPTFTLLRGAAYVKDNRILPLGWSDSDDYAETLAPAGVEEDGDFIGGSDTVLYEPNLPAGRYQATATLYFQVISPRHADELFQHNTEEVRQFKNFYQAADRKPEALATDSLKFIVK